MVSGRGRAGALAVAAAMLAGGLLWWMFGREPEGEERLPAAIEAPVAPRAVELPDPDARPASRAAPPKPQAQLVATATPAPTAAPRESADCVFLSGWLVDQQGVPLHAHELAVFGPDVRMVKTTSSPALATAFSARDGRFELTGDVTGTVRLRVRGPGEGDQPVLVQASRTAEVHIANEVDEGWIYLMVPDSRLLEATVSVCRHAAFWVTGRLEIEAVAESEAKKFSWDWRIEPPKVSLQNPSAPARREDAPALEPLGKGPLIPISSPHYERLLDDVFLAPAWHSEDRLLCVRKEGYLTETRELEARDSQSAGTIALSRVAGFRVAIGEPPDVWPESITVKESGGDRPERVTRLLPAGETTTHWCDRRAGTCEVSVTARGGLHGTATVELALPGDELPVVLVRLAGD